MAPQGLAPERTDPPALWRQTPVLCYLIARSGSTIAFHLLGVAVGYQVYTLTGSAFALGLIGLTQFGAMLTFTLLAGYLADQMDRRRLIAICQLIQSGVAATLALGVVLGGLSVPGIFVLVAIAAAARACEQPTEQALLPTLTTRDELPRVVALATSVNQACVVVGPALAGLFYGLDAAMPYAAAAAILVCAMLAVLGIPPQPRAPGKAAVSLAVLLSGLGFIRAHRLVLGAISLDLFTVLSGGMMVLLPVFAVDVLRTDAFGLGLLRSAPALGSLVTAFILARTSFSAVGPTMLASSVAFGLVTVAFAFSTSLILSLILLVALGAANVVGVVVRQTLVQLETPDAVRGRVSAASALFMGTSNQLGDFKAGLLAALIGPVAAVALGGLGAVAVGLLWLRLFPEIRRLSRF